MSLIETARRIIRKSALKQYPLRARLAVERLEDRTVPTTYFTWNGGYANNDFDDARNWYQGGTGPLPAASDSINFVNDPVTNVANPCNNFHAASGPYYAITVNFSSTVTLSTAITTQTFNMQKGNFARRGWRGYHRHGLLRLDFRQHQHQQLQRESQSDQGQPLDVERDDRAVRGDGEHRE